MPSRSKYLCCLTYRYTYKSPLEPPLEPASPSPATRSLEPLSTPAGILTFSFYFSLQCPCHDIPYRAR
ncbi:hypothetical protein EVA_19442 [gut metagenome]|uniref:Uncharacterized protein n=1 Tax=gut metagenome TaxID=749906 RepID=J9FC34_9ZZZZ